MNRLYRLGRLGARHPRRMIAAWLLVVVAAIGSAVAWGGALQENWDVPGARAQHGIEQLRTHFPESAGSSAQVVLHDRTPIDPGLTDQVAGRLRTTPHVVGVAPRVSPDGRTVLLALRYDVPTTDPAIIGDLKPLQQAARPASEAGVEVEYGGELAATVASMKGSGEIVGIVLALVLLVLAFGSVLAAGLPVLTALAGLAVGGSLVAVMARFTDVSDTAPTVATMVGLGVGIDYALLVLTRYVAQLRAGDEPVQAAAVATARAGRSVLGAGLTVLVSLTGLRLAGLPTFSAFGYATALCVGAVMIASLTLVPALCALAGRRVLTRRERRGGAAPAAGGTTLTARWAARVARRPLAWALAALAVMVGLALPALGMQTWPQDGGADSTSTTQRRAHDLIADAFGPGANGPFTVVADRRRLSDAEIAGVHATIEALPAVAGATPVVVSADRQVAVWDIDAVAAPGETESRDLLALLRTDVVPAGVEVTGYTPLLDDIDTMLSSRLWVVVGFVVGLSVLLLTLMFRSVVVPLKAAVMNLLSVAAAYGVMTLVFQHGVGVSLLGMDHAVAVSSWVPIIMFAVLFGLSMDYEVFMASAVRDDWLDTGDAHGSVTRGLASTGRVITIAAAIMVAVFLGFAAEPSVVVKMLGVGMAVAVGLDATLVRLVLVPATMTLLGERNWWFPRFGRAAASPETTRTPAPARSSR